jgi:hypothetical protein
LQQSAACALTLPLRQYIELIDPTFTEGDEPDQVFGECAPDLAVDKHTIAKECAVSGRRVKSRQPGKTLVERLSMDQGGLVHLTSEQPPRG